MRIYVSSTFEDLREHRVAAAQALRRVDCHPVAMEDYVACDDRPVDRCLDDVRSCQAYLGIFAWRVGYKPPGFEHAITYLEYQAARAARLPCFLFLVAEEHPWPDRWRDADPGQIDALRRRLREEHTVSGFTTPDNLAALVSSAVARWRYTQRKSVEVPFLLPYLADRSEQSHRLEKALREHATSSARRPLLVVVHGDEHEAHDMFLDRLEQVTLPRLLKLDTENRKVSSYRVSWSEPDVGVDDRLERLRARVAAALDEDSTASDEQLARHVASHRAPVLVTSSIVSSDWQRQEPELIERWADWWRSWTDLPPGQQLLVVLDVLYKSTPDAGFVQRWRRQSRTDRIRAFLTSLERRADSGLSVAVLPELKAVRETDIVHWLNSELVEFCRHAAGAAGDPARVKEALLPQLRELFRVEAASTRSDGVPMERLGKAMRELIDRALREAA